MASSDRFKRPTPERTAPIRGWSTLFSAAPGDGAGSARDAATGGGDQPLNDVIARSVDLGYRVVDEYIRQGQKAAQRINERSYGPDSMSSDAQDLAIRMLQYASDFAAVWVEFMQLASAGSAVRSTTGAPGAEANVTPTSHRAAPEPPRRDETTRWHIEVCSTQPTEVSLDVRPNSAHRPLIVHALRAPDPQKPRLTEVAIEHGADDSPSRLRIRVPSDQPCGTYSGVIVDEQSNRPVGSVTVRVGAP